MRRSEMPSKQKKILHIRISNFESEFKFDIPYKSTGKQLLDLICKTLALRETWYFGLQYVTLDNRGDIKLLWWLKPHKKIADQVTSEPRSAGASGPGCGCGGEHPPSAVLRFLFHPKLFPEDIVKEVVQDVTRHLFYLEVKNFLWRRRQDSVTSQLLNASTSEEDIVTMACLAAHADTNDPQLWPSGSTSNSAPPALVVPVTVDATASEASGGDLSELLSQMQAYLPASLVERWASVLTVWESRVRPRYLAELVHMAREEAELEYLRLAQKQPFFGVSLHPIFDKSKRGNLLGVAPSGLHVYNDHRLVQAHSWSEIKNVSYRDRKFTIKLNRFSGAPSSPLTSGSSSVTAEPSGTQVSSTSSSPNASNGSTHQWVFCTLDQAESKAVMHLCVGSHELYVWRRRPETLEMQQIKAQAREERAKKETDRTRLSREREEKVAALEAKSALEGRCAELEMALRRSKETAELWAEKANVAEEEARLLQKKADQTADALNRFHSVQLDLESRAREAASQALESRHVLSRQFKAAELGGGVESSSGEQLFLPTSPPLPRRADLRPVVPAENASIVETFQQHPTGSVRLPPLHSAVEALTEFELNTASSDQLLAALDRERQNFAMRNAQMKRQLLELRTEVEMIKNEHRQFSLDRLPFGDRIISQTVVTKFPSAQQVWSCRATTKSVEG